MNLHTATRAQLTRCYLPDEALRALRDGEGWEFIPDSIDGADEDVSYCDDRWHRTYTVWGLRLRLDGTLCEVEWSADTDGDRSFAGEYPYGTYNHAAERTQVAARWSAYSRWVDDHNGEDPLREFFSESVAERALNNQES
jgi:hypothetical protein